MDIDSLINLQPATLPTLTERKRLRLAFGVTQQMLADSLNVTRKTIAKWESGEWSPNGKNLANYTSVLSAWADTEKDSTQRKETQ